MTERLLAPKWANLLLAGTGLVVALTLVLVIWGGPKILSNTDDLNRGFNASTCRAELNSRLIGAAIDYRDNLTNRGLEASVKGEQAVAISIADAAPAARQEVRDARKEYDRLIALSRSHPGEYQAICNRLPDLPPRPR